MAPVEAILDLKQWGNNLGVRLPVNVARAAHLHVDQRVRVAVEQGHGGGLRDVVNLVNYISQVN